jgi:aryl-alcohol dehydrogenase-like predicted oxidoreductase
MEYVEYGGTGLTVSRLSMGCNRLGDPGADPAQWPPIVRQALEMGITFFDTSNSYNQGRSEEVLGAVTKSWPTRTVIATKGGVPVITNDFANRSFAKENMFAAAEDSLKRLQRDVIDLYMLHSPSVADLESSTGVEALVALKQQGKVRSWGISTHDHASGVWALKRGAEFLQIEYDMLDPSAEDELLPLAIEKNAGIMVRTPLARGLLSGKFRSGEGIPAEQQWRRPTGDKLDLRLRRVDQLRFLEREGQTLAQAALRWLMGRPGVHCVIPGARTVEQLEDNARAIDGQMTADERARVDQLHKEWRAEGRF